MPVVPAFCANAEDAAVTTNIVDKAERRNCVAWEPSHLNGSRVNALRILTFLHGASLRHHIVVAHDD
jgi:hypothetical protein